MKEFEGEGTMQKTIIATHWPTERGSYQGMVTQFGSDRAELINWALNTGDPLADKLAEDMHEVGMAHARNQFQIAAQRGIVAVNEPFPSLQAFFEEVEKIHDEMSDHLLDEAIWPHFTIPRSIHSIALTTGSLVRTYQSPSIANILALTGRLIEGADRRLDETAKWLLQATKPGSLRIGKEGYIATLNVRLLHAHMRRFALKKGYDEKVFGVAINQIDNTRTWLDFNYIPYRLASILGYDLTPSELDSLYSYWGYLGKLLGVDERLIAGVKDHASARRINEMVEAVTGAPIDESVTLAQATLTSLVKRLGVQMNMPPEKAWPFVNAITRRAQGNAMSDQLKIPRNPLADEELNQMIAANRSAREEMRNDIDQWEQAKKDNYEIEILAVKALTDAAAYERGASQADD